MNWNEILFFSIFLLFIILILSVDLGIFSKESHIVSFKESVFWTILWVSFSVGFYFFISTMGHKLHGIENALQLEMVIQKFTHPVQIEGISFSEALSAYNKNLGLEYITGYLIEYALSVDNIFVIILVFMAFGISRQHYHRILFWGIFGAVVMRFIFIFSASALIQQFSWILYLFGVLLVFTGIRMFLARNKAEKIDTDKHPVVRFASRHFSVAKSYTGSKFFIKDGGKKYITPLFIVLLVIEFTDVIFAVDSVPAIFSVTKDPFIVFFSNIFAIIGLRSLFFLIMNVMNYFHYLKTGLAILLVFIGLKLLFHSWLEKTGFETVHSLYVVLGILLVSMAASIIFPEKKAQNI